MEKMDRLNPSVVLARIKSETPRFWKVLRRYMIGCGVLGATLMAVKIQYTMEWLPDKVCEYLIVIGTVGTTIASLTATDKYEPVNQENG